LFSADANIWDAKAVRNPPLAEKRRKTYGFCLIPDLVVSQALLGSCRQLKLESETEQAIDVL
jgi:hypothetical protein